MSLGNTVCPRGTCHVTALVLDHDWITKNPENPVAEMFSLSVFWYVSLKFLEDEDV